MGKGSRHGKTKKQRRDQNERKRDERAQRNILKKEKQANEYGIDEDTFKSFSNQLKIQGFVMRDVIGDGNCLFRALADQLDGKQNMHAKHRKETVLYMKEHEDEFIPFIEETVTFENYLKSLSLPGTYGGNDSIVAFARNNGADVIIHQHNNPTFIIDGSHKSAEKIIIHLAYHDYEHYSSVRTCNDPGTGPGYTFHKEMDSIAIKNSNEEKLSKKVSNDNIKKSMQSVKENDEYITETVERIKNECGYQDSEYIRKTFVDNSYDIDLTLSFLLQIMSLGENSQCCDKGEMSEITHTVDSKMDNQPIVNADICNGNDKGLLQVEIKEDSYIKSEDSLPTTSCQQVLDEHTCGHSKTCTSKCTCDEGEETKEKSFQEVKKNDIPATKSVKKPSNRQRKELAKQARKKRHKESKKVSDTNDIHPLEKATESIKSINI